MRRRRTTEERHPAGAEEVLICQGLRKTYSDPLGKRSVTALDGIDWEIRRGERWAVVGRSGSGKTTLGRILALDVRPDGGEIQVLGEDPWCLRPAHRRRLRRSVQWIPQDPADALDPRFTVARAAAEPLDLEGGLGARWRGRRPEHREQVVATLAQVGLGADLMDRPVPALSGGQKRRLVIARALLAEPRVLVLDESFTGLDLSLRVQLEALLRSLHQDLGLTLVSISHDLRTIPRLADRVLVLSAGRVVERSTPAALLATPRHDESRALVAALALASAEGVRG